MKYKTISDHYDTVYSLEHNNRVFTPKNVDSERIVRNYNSVVAVVFLLCFPLIIPRGILLRQQQQRLIDELEQLEMEQWLRDMDFHATKLSLRDVLHDHDIASGAQYPFWWAFSLAIYE